MQRIAIALAVIQLAGLAGCVTYTTDVSPMPPLVGSDGAPPVIAVVDYAPADAARKEVEYFTQGLRSALARNPYMSNASLDPKGEVHYVFALQPSVTRSSFWALAVLTGALLPGTSTDVLRVTLTVYEPATGRDLLTVRAERDRRTIFWLPFIFAAPFNYAFQDHDPAEEVYNGVFTQAAALLAGRGLPPAVPAANLPRRGQIAPVPLPVQ